MGVESPGVRPTYRVGIVGTGGIARAHGLACQALDDVDLCAICDVSEAAVHRYGDQYDVPHRYQDLDEMLAAERLDVAIVCTWGTAHASTTIRLARSRRVRAILCEKPFAANAAEAEQMVAAAREHGVLLAEAFKFRHHPLHLKTKALVDAGAIGEVRTVRSTFCTGIMAARRRPELNWRFNRAQGGGSIFDLGCYTIHHARYILDDEPTRVFATARAGVEVEEAATVTLLFPDERTAQLTVSFSQWPSQEVEVSGTEGLLRARLAWNNERQAVTLEHHTAEGVETIGFAPQHQITNQLRHLCDCLGTGQPHRIPPENSIAQMRVIDAVFESMATGQPVEMAG